MKNKNKEIMKTKIDKFNCRKALLFIGILFVSTIGSIQAMAQKLNESQAGSEKSVSASVPIDARPKVSIAVYDTKTDILPARNNAVEVYMDYIAEGDENDLKKLHQAIKKNLILKSGDKITIGSKFYESYMSVNALIINRITMKLQDGSKLHLDKFEITGLKIYVPADMDLTLEAKYSKVEMQMSVAGFMDVLAYDSEVEAKSVKHNLTIEAKYSTLQFESAHDVNVDFYETNFKIREMKALSSETRYSQMEIDALTTMKNTGYEDQVEIGEAKQIKIDSRYSEFDIDNCPTIEAKMYEGGISVKKVGDISFEGKYAELDFGQIGNLKVNEGYELEVDIQKADSIFSKEGKYNDWEIEELAHMLKIDGYEEEISLGRVLPTFSFIDLNGKYIDLEMNLSKAMGYTIKGIVQYPEFNFDRSQFNTVFHEKESSELKFEYQYGKQNKKRVELNGYEMDVKLYYY